MKNYVIGASCYIASICIILMVLVTSVDINAFNQAFYESEYTHMNTAEELEMSHLDLMSATSTLLTYLQDERDNIDTEITVREMPRPAFNERETLHMVDVKDLYQWALQVRNTSVVVLLLCIGYLIFKKGKESLEYLSIAFTQVAMLFIGVVCLLGVWALCDFTSLWESFHHLFFSNDLWLLNPRTDLMITMFPEAFFLHMVMRIAGMFMLVFSILFGGSIWYRNKKTHFLSIWRKVR